MSENENDENTLFKIFEQEFPRFKTPNHPCTQEEFNESLTFKQKKTSTITETIRRNSTKCNIYSFFISLLPVLGWLPQYNFKKHLIRDLQAGFTIAVIQIPQGMAYASLGGVNPIVGIYMAMFPNVVYFLLGTSRHISLGTFSVICLMTSEPIKMYSKSNNETLEVGSQTADSSIYTPIQVAAVASLTVGLIQVIMSVCRIGSISTLMPESFVSGLTTASAVVVVSSQLQHVIGVDIESYYGRFNIIYLYISLFQAIPNTNYVALALSVSAIMILTLYTDLLVPKLKITFPIPMEMLVLILGILLSYSFQLRERYAINVIGTIPSGLPHPMVPPVELMGNILSHCLTIAVVSFSINISLASMFASKGAYQVDANQEMLALGCCNIFGSLFHCLPLGASIARTMVQYACGDKTQLTSIFSCFFLLIILLFSTSFLGPLPYSVLAGIVIKSLRGMLLQALNLPKIWKSSFLDGIMWTSTFISVVFISIESGLAIALCLAIFYIVWMRQKINVSLLGKVENTNIYLELERYASAKPIPGFVIIDVSAGLDFANIHLAINKIELLMNISISRQNALQPPTLVLDMLKVSFVDPQALNGIACFIERCRRRNINFCLANCSVKVYEEMKRCNFINVVSENAYFPTIHDAVVYFNDIRHR